jgi:hypothetical protein
MHIFLRFLALVILFSAASGAWAENSKKILASLQKSGCAATLKQYPEGPEWNTVLFGVQTGFPDWVKVYKGLSHCVSGIQEKELNEALQAAVPNNPYLIFDEIKVIKQRKVSVADLCTPHFDNDAENGMVKSYMAALMLELEHPRDQHDVQNRVACMRALQEARIAYNVK